MHPMSPATRRLIVLGMFCLALANVSHWFVARNHLLDTDLGDGLFGLLMGIAIGLLLVALRRGRCRPAD